MKKTIIYLVIGILGITFIGCKKATSSETYASQKKAVETNISSTTVQETVPLGNWGNAPDFTLPSLDGSKFTLSSLQGKVIILDFWATWCPPCRMEIPGFVELQNQYKDQGLEIVGIALDQGGVKDVAPFAEKTGINYQLVIGNQGITARYGGIRGIPTTFIIDRNGNIVNKHVGFASKEVFEKEIKELL